jgi:hypothetical protein
MIHALSLVGAATNERSAHLELRQQTARFFQSGLLPYEARKNKKQDRRLFPFAHHLDELVLDSPGRAVAAPDVTLQLQGGDVVLDLCQKIHGLEPSDYAIGYDEPKPGPLAHILRVKC